MARRLIPLAALALAFALLAAPAQAVRLTQKTETVTRPAPHPGLRDTFFVDCEPGFNAVAAAVVAHESLVTVYSMRRVGSRRWRFDVRNDGGPGFPPSSVTVEVKCVRTGRIDFEYDTETVELDEPSERFDEETDCPPGFAPIGTGFSHYPPGGRPGDPPPDDAFIHTFDSAFVRGGFDTLLQSTGQGDVIDELGFLCVDRRDRVRGRLFLQTVRRLLQTVDAPPEAPFEFTGRCPRGSVATGLGFNTPDDATVHVEPRGWTGRRTVHFAGFNVSSENERSVLQWLCLSQERR